MRNLYYILLMIKSLPRKIFSNIDFSVIIKNGIISSKVAIEKGSKIYNSKIGRYSYIGRNSTICSTEIGSFCSISDNCIINAGKHPMSMVSSSPVFYRKTNIFNTCFNVCDFDEYEKWTHIGNDVWIGSHVFIKGGLTIGNGAIIGAYSVVTKDVAPYSIVVGNPAKEIKKRFDMDTIKKLEKIQWWEWTARSLKDYGHLFNDPQLFLEYMQSHKLNTSKK